LDKSFKKKETNCSRFLIFYSGRELFPQLIEELPASRREFPASERISLLHRF